MVHTEERSFVRAGFARRFPEIPDPPLLVIQALQACGWAESRYARAWKTSDGKASKNKGCVQDSRPPCNPERSFQATDTHPNADGTSTPYHICFKIYLDDVAAWDDVARIMYRQIRVGTELRRPALEAALAGDLYGVSAGMYAQRYYEGFGKTPSERIANHYKGLRNGVLVQAKELLEPAPGYVPPPPVEEDDFLPDNPLILRGSRGPYVKTWQQILNDYFPDDVQTALVLDGRFGEHTAAQSVVWQRAHGLKGDGKIGPLSWAAAAKDAA